MNYNEFINFVKKERYKNEFLSFPFYTKDEKVCIFTYQVDLKQTNASQVYLTQLNRIYVYDSNKKNIDISKNNLLMDFPMCIKTIPVNLKELKEIRVEFETLLEKLVNNEKVIEEYCLAYKKLIKDDFQLIYKRLNSYVEEV